MGSQAVLDGERKISPLPRFDSRTIHCVASRYIDYAIPVPTRAMLHITKWLKTLLHTAGGGVVNELMNKEHLVEVMETFLLCPPPPPPDPATA